MSLDQLQHEAFAAGRRAWPNITADRAAFSAWASEQGIEARALASHGPDLFLASACAAGDPAAISAFETTFVQNLRPTLGRVALEPEMLDELRQTLRVRLLTGPMPKIRQYKGNGPLGAWVRVTATRIALELKEAMDRRGTSNSVVLDALTASGSSPELTAAKLQHRELFRSELERCFEELDAKDKNLLRMFFLHDMNIDDMGAILRVHRATVARWLVALRRRIFDRLCSRLAVQINSASEMNSLIRLVRSDVELSVHRLLAPEKP